MVISPACSGMAMAGREARHDFVRAGDRLGVNHHDAGVVVAVPGHLGGAVGVGGPEMMVVDLAAIHVFPARVEQAAIGQRPGGIVLLVVAGDGADVLAAGVAAIQDGDLREPAVHPALAARGDEDDVAVGQVGGLDVVVRAVRELAQAGAIGVDLAEVILLGAALAIAEEDLAAVVVDLRVAHAAARVIEQRGELARGQVQAIELGAFPPCLARRVVGVVADVGIPMPVGLVDPARGEDDIVHARHRPGAELVEQGGGGGRADGERSKAAPARQRGQSPRADTVLVRDARRRIQRKEAKTRRGGAAIALREAFGVRRSLAGAVAGRGAVQSRS